MGGLMGEPVEWAPLLLTAPELRALWDATPGGLKDSTRFAVERILADRLAALTQDRDRERHLRFAMKADRDALDALLDEARTVVEAVRAQANEWDNPGWRGGSLLREDAGRRLRALLPEPETSEAGYGPARTITGDTA